MPNADRLIQIYHEAQARPAGAERDRFLVESCGDDIALREKIVSLLRSHESAGDFLQEPLFFPTPVITEKPGDTIGRYQLLEKLGEGGCGVVYVAEQTQPVRRRVALKVIKLGMDTKQVISRFEAERQALAMMDSPNIAKVFDAGSTETGRPYFVMELVQGLRLTEYCDQNNLAITARLDLFIKVCHAIQHAHQKGVIHRDIKPSNILVTLHDGVPVPKVIDFGIAKATEGRLMEGTVYTQFLQFVGTPAYMSPEQAEMSGMDIDTRSDIYSLGVLLYELLAGQPPFDGQKLLASGLDAMRKTIRETEPTRPSTKLRETTLRAEVKNLPSKNAVRAPPSPIDSDLDWIVMKCLEKDRFRRYETANGLAADLRRHLNHEAVVARPPTAAYRFQKAWRRNKLVFAAAGAVAIALLLGLGVSAWLASQAIEARNSADLEKASALHEAYVANMFSAGPAWEEFNYQKVRQLLADTRASSHRGFEWYYWQRQTHLNLMTLYGHTNVITSIAYFPDGQRIVTGSRDESARVWDMATGKEQLKLLGHTSWVNSVVVSPNGREIATASRDQTVIVWDSTSGQNLLTLKGHGNPLNALAFSPDGRRILTGGNDSVGRIWDVARREVTVTLEGHTNWITAVAFSPDGSKVVTASTDQTARVWRASDGTNLLVLPLSREIMTVACSPDGREILTGSLDQRGQFWNAETGAPLEQLVTKEPMVTLAFSTSGQRIVTGGWNSVARVWNATNRTTDLFIRGHVRGLQAVGISPDGTRVVTGGYDWAVKVWDAEGKREQLRVKWNPTNSVLAVAISPDGRRIVTGSGTFNNDGSTTGSGEHALQIWDSNTKETVVTISAHTSGVSSVAFSPNGAQVLSGSGDRTAKLWDAGTGILLSTFKGHTASVSSVAFFLNAERIATGSQDRTARVWDSATGLELLILAGHIRPISSVAVSPDGKRIVTGSHDETAKVWDAATGDLLRTIKVPDSKIYSVAISPDSRCVAIAGYEATTVWELGDTTREPLILQGHSTPISSVAFSPDGLRIVTGGLNGLGKLWEAATGRELLTLGGHNRFIYSVAVSSDGQRIITGSADQTARIWEAATKSQVAAWEAEERDAARLGYSR